MDSHVPDSDGTPGAPDAPIPKPESPRSETRRMSEPTLSAHDLYEEVKKLRSENAKYRRGYGDYKKKYEAGDSEWKAKYEEAQAKILEVTEQYEELQQTVEFLTPIVEQHFEIDDEGNLFFKDEIIETLQEQLAPELAEEVASLREQLTADPNSLQAKYAALEQQIQARDHRDAWSKAVDGKLADGMDLDTLWKLTGYEPKGEVSEEAIAQSVKAALEAKPFAFKASGQESDGQTPGGSNRDSASGQVPEKPKPQPLTNGLDAGRGALGGGSGKFLVHRGRLTDPEYNTPEFQSQMREARTAGTLEYVDE